MEVKEIKNSFESREDLEKYIEFLRSNRDSIRRNSGNEGFRKEIVNFVLGIINRSKDLYLKEEICRLDDIYKSSNDMSDIEFLIRYGSIEDSFLNSIRVQIKLLEGTGNDDKIDLLYKLGDRYYKCNNKREERDYFIRDYLRIVDGIKLSNDLRLAKKKK